MINRNSRNSVAVVVCALALGTASVPAFSQAPAAATSRAPAVAADNPLQLKPDHVTISVADIDKAAKWYTQVLGFKEFARSDGAEFRHRQLEIPGVYRVDLSWRKGSARHTVGKPSDLEQGWRHIVFTTADIENTLKLLQAQHVEVRVDRNKQTNVISQMFIADPEGNEIELQPR